MKLCLIVACLAGLLGCSSSQDSDAREAFAIELRAASQDGVPLAGVAFSIDGKAVGTTNGDGRLSRQLRGVEGNSVGVSAACPTDFEQLAPPTPLRLTHTRAIGAQSSQPLTIDVKCNKLLNDVLVVVRAERGDQLPVLVDGKAVGTTDQDGIAHVLLRRPRTDTSVQLGIDTTTRPALKPGNPTRSFDLHGRDAVVLFEPSFAVKKAQAPQTSAPRRHIPIRVD